MEGGAVGHNFERDPPKGHPCQVLFNSVQGFQRRRFKCETLRSTADGRSDGRTDGRRRTTDAKWWQKLTWPLARWAKKVLGFPFKKTLTTVLICYCPQSVNYLREKAILILILDTEQILKLCLLVLCETRKRASDIPRCIYKTTTWELLDIYAYFSNYERI